MSIQDDIFDVRDALKRKRELKQFDTLMTYLGEVEATAEEYRQAKKLWINSQA